MMKEVTDLLKDLKRSLDEAAQFVENMESFPDKSLVLESIDSAYNEISYTLGNLSSAS